MSHFIFSSSHSLYVPIIKCHLIRVSFYCLCQFLFAQNPWDRLLGYRSRFRRYYPSCLGTCVISSDLFIRDIKPLIHHADPRRVGECKFQPTILDPTMFATSHLGSDLAVVVLVSPMYFHWYQPHLDIHLSVTWRGAR